MWKQQGENPTWCYCELYYKIDLEVLMCLFFFCRDTATTVNVPHMTNNVKTCGGLVWTFCLLSFKADCTFFCSKRWRLCLKSWWRHPLILPKRGCAVQQGMVFGVFESLKRVYDFIRSSDFVRNSYVESWDSSCEKSRVPVQNYWISVQKTTSFKLKKLGSLCNQAANSLSQFTEIKT